MQFVRVYEKKYSKRDSKWTGYVGKVMLESDVTVVKLNGKPIHENSIEYLLNFGLQMSNFLVKLPARKRYFL